jgi:hypothetical protein
MNRQQATSWAAGGIHVRTSCENARWIAYGPPASRYVGEDDCASANDCIVANTNSAKYARICANINSISDDWHWLIGATADHHMGPNHDIIADRGVAMNDYAHAAIATSGARTNDSCVMDHGVKQQKNHVVDEAWCKWNPEVMKLACDAM